MNRGIRVDEAQLDILKEWLERVGFEDAEVIRAPLPEYIPGWHLAVGYKHEEFEKKIKEGGDGYFKIKSQEKEFKAAIRGSEFWLITKEKDTFIQLRRLIR